MGKKNKNNTQQQPQQHEESNNAGDTEVGQKEGGEVGDNKDGKNKNGAIVLKIELHCEGCASRVLKIARSFPGVESVKVDSESNKLTVMGKLNPSQIRDFLHQKTKKNVDLLSPQPKKDDSNKKSDDKKPEKSKETPVTTAVIKVAFHCSGCIEKIHKIVSKTKGLHDMAMDKQKETVTVKGTMDVKALTQALKERLKRSVEIVPPKKEKDGSGDGGDGEKGGSGDGGKKKKKGGGEGQDNAVGGGGEVASAKIEGNRMEYMMQPGFGYGFGPGPGYGYMGQNGYMGQPVAVYGNGYVGMAPPPPVYDSGCGQVAGYPVHMKFNDENPNACSVM